MQKYHSNSEEALLNIYIFTYIRENLLVKWKQKIIVIVAIKEKKTKIKK